MSNCSLTRLWKHVITLFKYSEVTKDMCNNLPLDIQFEMLKSMSIKRQTIDGQENLKYFDVKSPAC